MGPCANVSVIRWALPHIPEAQRAVRVSQSGKYLCSCRNELNVSPTLLSVMSHLGSSSSVSTVGGPAFFFWFHRLCSSVHL